jgi:hypothetical protein
MREPGRLDLQVKFEEGWTQRGAVSLCHWKFVGPAINRILLHISTILLPAVFTAWALVILVRNWGEADSVFTLLMLSGAAAMVMGRTARGVGWQLRTRAPLSTWFGPNDHVSVLASPSGLTITRNGLETHVGREAIEWAGITSGHLVTIFKGNSGLAIPHSAFADATKMSEFVSTVDRVRVGGEVQDQGLPGPSSGNSDYQLHFVPTHTDAAVAMAESYRSRNELSGPYRIVIGAFCAFFLWASWPWTQHPGLLFLFVPTFAALGTYALLASWLDPLTLRALGRRMAASGGAAGPTDCWFTPAGFHVTTNGSDSFTPWKEVHRLVPDPNRIAIMGHRWTLLVVPASAFESQVEYQRFVAYLSDRFANSTRAA